METNRTSYIKKYDKILIYITVYTIVFFFFCKDTSLYHTLCTRLRYSSHCQPNRKKAYPLDS